MIKKICFKKFAILSTFLRTLFCVWLLLNLMDSTYTRGIVKIMIFRLKNKGSTCMPGNFAVTYTGILTKCVIFLTLNLNHLIVRVYVWFSSQTGEYYDLWINHAKGLPYSFFIMKELGFLLCKKSYLIL